MKHIKLNEKEMSHIYGGIHTEEEVDINPDGTCVTADTCVCHPRQPDAKVTYGENMARKDRNWGT